VAHVIGKAQRSKISRSSEATSDAGPRTLEILDKAGLVAPFLDIDPAATRLAGSLKEV